eukprot:NODE_2475_length_475_cov_1.659091_g2458_i0.p1 GENE.NODE_2475_length_475_cov_1.659091_g2458_i0~~NODE_2475_length_475_cov_1.659091_g2458_i0.p1  ORF type:complete len:150 (+),score=16.30 NODE_2475_length_475_cov_1.659091_g2458_i0:50-451(+)
MIVGMSKGPQNTANHFFSSLHPDPNNVRTSQFPLSLMNAVATRCAISTGIKGYNTTLANGFNSSLGAVCYGYEIVRQNLQRYMLVGGADEYADIPWLFIYAGLGWLNWSGEESGFTFFINFETAFFPRPVEPA